MFSFELKTFADFLEMAIPNENSENSKKIQLGIEVAIVAEPPKVLSENEYNKFNMIYLTESECIDPNWKTIFLQRLELSNVGHSSSQHDWYRLNIEGFSTLSFFPNEVLFNKNITWQNRKKGFTNLCNKFNTDFVQYVYVFFYIDKLNYDEIARKLNTENGAQFHLNQKSVTDISLNFYYLLLYLSIQFEKAQTFISNIPNQSNDFKGKWSTINQQINLIHKLTTAIRTQSIRTDYDKLKAYLHYLYCFALIKTADKLKTQTDPAKYESLATLYEFSSLIKKTLDLINNIEKLQRLNNEFSPSTDSTVYHLTTKLIFNLAKKIPDDFEANDKRVTELFKTALEQWNIILDKDKKITPEQIYNFLNKIKRDYAGAKPFWRKLQVRF